MKSYLTQCFAGMPVWSWCLVVVLGAVNEAINRAKWTKAQSIIQGVASFLLDVPVFGTILLAKSPIVGWLLRRLATPPMVAVLAQRANDEPVPVAPRSEKGMADTTTLVHLWLGAIVIGAGLALLVTLAAGCGGAVTNLYRTTATAAVVTSTAYRALDELDAAKEGEIKAKAEGSDVAGAKRLRDDWRPKYAAARKAVDAASAATEMALSALPVIEHAASRDKDAGVWIARLMKLCADLVGPLELVGVHVPALAGGVK